MIGILSMIGMEKRHGKIKVRLCNISIFQKFIILKNGKPPAPILH